MGKGDLKTRRGKINNRSYGNSRPRNPTKVKLKRKKVEKDKGSLISNRPKYLKDNIKFYNRFPLDIV